MEIPAKFAHGGARHGAGRKAKKPTEKRKARLLMLSDTEKKQVDAMRGKQTFSAYIRNRLGLAE